MKTLLDKIPSIITKGNPTPCEVINRHIFTWIDVTHETQPLKIHMNEWGYFQYRDEHHKSPSIQIILRLLWFKIHNSNVNWLVGKIYSKINCHPRQRPIRSICIGIKVFLQATNTNTPFMVYVIPTNNFEQANHIHIQCLLFCHDIP